MACGDAWERLRWPLPFGMLIEWDLGMDMVFYGVGGESLRHISLPEIINY